MRLSLGRAVSRVSGVKAEIAPKGRALILASKEVSAFISLLVRTIRVAGIMFR